LLKAQLAASVSSAVMLFLLEQVPVTLFQAPYLAFL
jgi:hypothetical protein